MGGRRTIRTMLLLLVTCDLTYTAMQTITIELMDLKYDEANVSTLTVCSSSTLKGDNITLTVTQTVTSSTQKDYTGSKSSNDSCADFSGTGEDQLPVVPTTYEMYVYDVSSTQKGTVTFAFPNVTGATLNCATSQFARFTTPSGRFVDESCLPGLEDHEVCYTRIEDTHVCVSGVASNEEFVAYPFSEISLNYEDGSVTIAPHTGGQSTRTELLGSSEDDAARVAPCTQDSCSFGTIAPSTRNYELCGVYLNGSGAVTDVRSSLFKDLGLTMAGVSPIIDFYFNNKYDGRIYEVYQGPDSDTVLEGDPIYLDCQRVPEETSCYGFIHYSGSLPAYVAIMYRDDTNYAVISSTKTFSKNFAPDYKLQ